MAVVILFSLPPSRVPSRVMPHNSKLPLMLPSFSPETTKSIPRKSEFREIVTFLYGVILTGLVIVIVSFIAFKSPEITSSVSELLLVAFILSIAVFNAPQDEYVSI